MVVDETLLNTLAKFGFSQYEAKVYMALIKIGASNAYTVSKESGVPRARVYDVLEGLSKRGMVMFEDVGNGKMIYSPVPVKVFLERVRSSWKTDFDYASRELRELESSENPRESYISVINGGAAIIAFCKSLIGEAERKVVVSMNGYMYQSLQQELLEARERGCILAGVTFTPDTPIPPLERHHDRKTHRKKDRANWFILSTDSQNLFYGHSAEYDDSAFFTTDLTHVYLLEDYIYHDVILNRLTQKDISQNIVDPIIEDVLPYFE